MDDEKLSRRRSPGVDIADTQLSSLYSHHASQCGKMYLKVFISYALFMFLLSPVTCKALCPSICSCHDDTLRTTCIDANLEVVPIQFNPYVEYINLHDNRIHSVDYTLQNYHNLKHFDLSVNKIHSLKSHNFELQERLAVLNISRNIISSLGKGTFKGLKSLQILDISYNHIETIHFGAFKDTTELEVLDLSYNKISYFNDEFIFKPLRKLRTIYLQGNQLIDVPVLVLKHLPTSSLEVLKLSENLIEALYENSFPSAVFSNLKTLTLGSNVIRNIDRSTFNSLYSLSVLDLSDNNLTYIPTEQLAKLSQLTELDLSTNMFSEVRPVAFQSLFHLHLLKLSFMARLSAVDPRAFVDNINLESVIIDKNPNLRTIPTRIFHGNHHLVHVSMKDNALERVDSSHFPLGHLKSLDLSGNPLNCNCSLLWLWDLVQQEFRTAYTTANPLNDSLVLPPESQRLRLNIRNLKCNKPETMNNVLLIDVPESIVKCETTWWTVAIVTAFVLTVFAAMCILLLLINTDTRAWICWRHKDAREATGVESRRLASNIHNDPPILMLMPDNMKGHGDLRYLEPWCDTSRRDLKKPPHIVYV